MKDPQKHTCKVDQYFLPRCGEERDSLGNRQREQAVSTTFLLFLTVYHITDGGCPVRYEYVFLPMTMNTRSPTLLPLKGTNNKRTSL